MDNIKDSLPRWDLTPVYPSLDSPEFEQGFAKCVAAIDGLEELFERHGVKLQEPRPMDDALAAAFDEVINRLNAVLKETSTLGVYIHCHVAADSRNTLAQARLSELQLHYVRIQKLGTRFTAWIGSLDVMKLLCKSEPARMHAYMLRLAKEEAEHLMSPAEEELSADLQITGSTAWEKLYTDFTSQLGVPFERDGKTEELSMSKLRNLAYDPDRDVRRRAYEAERLTWVKVAVPVAAAMNSIKGATNTLAKRHKWADPLEAVLFDSHMDRDTLMTMLNAARGYFPHFRRYLRAKARALKLEKLAWYDLFAPVGQSGKVWKFTEAREFIVGNFGNYSQRLSDFAARAFRENWIDAEPRTGKVGGAFCTELRDDESRVLANYNYSFGGVTTLAHELGHAYHNLNCAQRTPLQQATPMTLAETASIFCETIVTQAALQNADRNEQLAILDESLQGATQVVVDITSRFLFEQQMLAARVSRELSVEEMNAIMLQAQKDTYGDGLDEETLNPCMWEAKGHYYGSTFYNFPYMFGLLFGLGLYAQYRQDPERFRGNYDELLSMTGMEDAATLAGRFGINLKEPQFWEASLEILRGDIDRYEALVDGK